MQLFSTYIRAVKTPLKDTMTAAMEIAHDLQAEAEKRVLSPLQASRDQRYAPYLKNASFLCRKAGIELDLDSPVKLSLALIDKQLRSLAPPLSIEDRMELKAALGRAGLLL